jgi:hypothetical protein
MSGSFTSTRRFERVLIGSIVIGRADTTKRTENRIEEKSESIEINLGSTVGMLMTVSSDLLVTKGSLLLEGHNEKEATKNHRAKLQFGRRRSISQELTSNVEDARTKHSALSRSSAQLVDIQKVVWM